MHKTAQLCKYFKNWHKLLKAPCCASISRQAAQLSYTTMQSAPSEQQGNSDKIKCFSTNNYRINMHANKWQVMHQMIELDAELRPQLDIEEVKEFLDLEHVRRVHDHNYIERFLNGQMTHSEMQKIGIPHSQALLQRVQAVTTGTLNATFHVLKQHAAAQKESPSCMRHKLFASVNMAGGAHHAHFAYGMGYCVWNDIVVAGEAAIANNLIKHYTVIDLDVHQGDGTASLCGNKQDHVFTFSMHVQSNFPLKKMQSSWDIGLADWIEDHEYLNILEDALKQMPRTDLVIFQSGVDVCKFDRLGKASLTLEGLAKRDLMVYEYCLNNNIPLVVTMGGGYPNESKGYTVAHVAEAHAQTIKLLTKVPLKVNKE